MAIESPLGPIIANVFLSFYEVKWLELCQRNLSQFFYRRYVDGIFVSIRIGATHLEIS